VNPRGARVPADAGAGLGRLVVAVLEILRDLLERQALRRMSAGSLSPDEVERLGQALISLQRQFGELRAALGADEPSGARPAMDLAALLNGNQPDTTERRPV
jgi:hypothetical protein